MASPEFTINLSDYGFDEFIRSLREKQVVIGDKVPMNAVANTAAIGRSASERTVIASSFRMGEAQMRGRKGETQTGTFTKWSSKVGGWVSKGSGNRLGEARRMGNFSFESLKKRSRGGDVKVSQIVKASYSHLLVNLFERPTSFSRNSPIVGPLWGGKTQYRAGDTRKAVPVLSSITSSMRQAVPKAIKRTERRFAKEIEE